MVNGNIDGTASVSKPVDGFLHVFELKDGVLYLDGRRIKGLLSYELKKSSALDLTELTLKLDVDV